MSWGWWDGGMKECGLTSHRSADALESFPLMLPPGKCDASTPWFMVRSWPQLYLPRVTFFYHASAPNGAPERAINLSNIFWFMPKSYLNPSQPLVFLLLKCVLVGVFVHVKQPPLHTFKDPIMMMICSQQLLHLGWPNFLTKHMLKKKNNIFFFFPLPLSSCLSPSFSSSSSPAVMLRSSMQWQNTAVMHSSRDVCDTAPKTHVVPSIAHAHTPLLHGLFKSLIVHNDFFRWHTHACIYSDRVLTELSDSSLINISDVGVSLCMYAYFAPSAFSNKKKFISSCCWSVPSLSIILKMHSFFSIDLSV